MGVICTNQMSLRKRSSKLTNSSSKHLFSGAYSLVSGSVSTKRKPESLKVRLVEHKISQMKTFGEFEHLNDALAEGPGFFCFFFAVCNCGIHHFQLLLLSCFLNLGVIFF